jgi:hypothetical protein
MSADLLVHLPFLIIAWTSLNLSWGIFTGLAVDKIMQYQDIHHGSHRQSDQTVHAAIWICNSMMFLYLFLVSGYVAQCADFVLVFDIFVTSFLAYINIGVGKWYSVCAHLPIIRRRHPFVAWMV